MRIEFVYRRENGEISSAKCDEIAAKFRAIIATHAEYDFKFRATLKANLRALFIDEGLKEIRFIGSTTTVCLRDCMDDGNVGPVLWSFRNECVCIREK